MFQLISCSPKLQQTINWIWCFAGQPPTLLYDGPQGGSVDLTYKSTVAEGMEKERSKYAMDVHVSSMDNGGRIPIYMESSSRHGCRRDLGGSRPFATGLSPGLASLPMSIPSGHSFAQDDIAPPPLPPPRFVPVGGPCEAPFDSMGRRHPPAGESWKSQSSGYESQPHSLQPDRRECSDQSFRDHKSFHDRKPSNDYTNRAKREIDYERDEGYHSFTSSLSNTQESLPRLFMSHDQFKFRPSANEYDNSLLKKFDARRTLDHRPLDSRSSPHRGPLSSSAIDVAPRFVAGESLLRPRLQPLSLPIRSNNDTFFESPSVTTDSAFQNTISSRPHSDFSSGVEIPSRMGSLEADQPFSSRTRRIDTVSSPQGTYESRKEESCSPQDEYLDIRRECTNVGQKRRASSPPLEGLSFPRLPGSGEILRRREGATRSSPTPRLSMTAQGPASSCLASASARNNSYSSVISMAATSMSSLSFGRRSPPGLISPGAGSPVDTVTGSPYRGSHSLTQSPMGSFARTPNQRSVATNPQSMSPRKISDTPKSTAARIQGYYMCECCPKKPKKFETAEDLSAHEAEKQYECSFCGNRFKNKNEAERHQNSLHVRRHSWSCSALHMAGYEKAFHESSTRPGVADLCGYCGEEFLRTGPGIPREVTNRDLEDRLRHLQDVHKFRECNSSKKFFRADHFRQHLKHSHGGTSGKWTNMLETACMIEEEPPRPRT